MFRVKKERINFDKELGAGNFGAVYPYQKDSDDHKWVIKRVHANNSDKLLMYLPEIVLGFSCDHPDIVPLKGYSIEKIDDRAYYIYLKFPRMKGTLSEKFDQQKQSQIPFSEREIVRYFYSFVSAMDYLHTKKIYHRDIKPGNILLDEDGNAKLSDIGVAKYVGDDEKYEPLTGLGGTVSYTAPEMLKEDSNLTKESLMAADTWSLGLMMLELCMLEKRLFSPYSSLEDIQKSQNSVYDKLKERYSIALIDLIFKLIKIKPDERIKIADVKKRLEDEFSGFLDLQKKEGQAEKSEVEIQEVRTSVAILTHENNQLQNELKNLQSLVNEFQSQKQPSAKAQEVLESVAILKDENNKLQNELKNLKSLMSGFQLKISNYLEFRAESKKKIPIDFSRLIDTLILGEVYSGRTCILNRFGSNTFFETLGTVCGDMKIKTLTQNGQSLKLKVRDCATQDRFKSLYVSEIRNALVVLIAYRITLREDFENLSYWIELQREHSKCPSIVFIVGTWLDLRDKRKVSQEEAEEFALKNKVFYIEVSSKTAENYDKLEKEIGEAILDRYCDTQSSSQNTAPKDQKKPSW